MSALSNENSSHEGVPKGLYPLVLSRSDWKTVSARPVPQRIYGRNLCAAGNSLPMLGYWEGGYGT